MANSINGIKERLEILLPNVEEESMVGIKHKKKCHSWTKSPNAYTEKIFKVGKIGAWP